MTSAGSSSQFLDSSSTELGFEFDSMAMGEGIIETNSDFLGEIQRNFEMEMEIGMIIMTKN